MTPKNSKEPNNTAEEEKETKEMMKNMNEGLLLGD